MSLGPDQEFVLSLIEKTKELVMVILAWLAQSPIKSKEKKPDFISKEEGN